MRQRYLKFAAGVLAMLLLLLGCSIEKVSTGELSTTEPETTVEDTTQPAPETTAEPEKETVSIIMVGDVLLHEKAAESGKRDDGTYNYDHFFANVKDETQGADIAIVNQEVILGGKELGLTGYQSFNGAFEVGDAEACVRKQPLRLRRRGGAGFPDKKSSMKEKRQTPRKDVCPQMENYSSSDENNSCSNSVALSRYSTGTKMRKRSSVPVFMVKPAPYTGWEMQGIWLSVNTFLSISAHIASFSTKKM